MNNIIEALQKLYVALGGQAADVANFNITPEMISAIADVINGSGGSTLPAVSGDDNGKLLTVVEGGWNKADAPKELPALESGTTDNGKLLTASNGQWGKADRVSDLFIAHYTGTPDQSDPNTIHWSCDKTFAEIVAAIGAGKSLCADGEIVGSELGYTRTTSYVLDDDGIEYHGVVFWQFGADTMPAILSINHASNASITMHIIPLVEAE